MGKTPRTRRRFNGHLMDLETATGCKTRKTAEAKARNIKVEDPYGTARTRITRAYGRFWVYYKGK